MGSLASCLPYVLVVVIVIAIAIFFVVVPAVKRDPGMGRHECFEDARS